MFFGQELLVLPASISSTNKYSKPFPEGTLGRTNHPGVLFGWILIYKYLMLDDGTTWVYQRRTLQFSQGELPCPFMTGATLEIIVVLG